MAFQREIAHRAFAQEFNAGRVQIEGQGEKEPSFLVTPLGAKVNRIHIVGVCTDVESVGDSGEVWRARISDPTGVFTVYAGNYQPEAAHALSQLQPPQFVAVTGKARTYEPEPGSIFVSVRPEAVNVVDEGTRNQWILDTARRSLERLEVVERMRRDPATTAEALTAQGVPQAIAEGAILSQTHYGLQDTQRYWHAVETALEMLGTGEVTVHRQAPAAAPEVEPAAPAAWKAPASAPAPTAAQGEANDALDGTVLAAVQRLEGSKGARWDDIVNDCAKGGATGDTVEEALNRLMDKGLVYEPTLGILKTT
jgi:RPA family protein